MPDENQAADAPGIIEIRAPEGGQTARFTVEKWDAEAFKWAEIEAGDLLPNETRSLELGEQTVVRVWRAEGPAEAES